MLNWSCLSIERRPFFRRQVDNFSALIACGGDCARAAETAGKHLAQGRGGQGKARQIGNKTWQNEKKRGNGANRPINMASWL